jgi:hypothetical protein
MGNSKLNRKVLYAKEAIEETKRLKDKFNVDINF